MHLDSPFSSEVGASLGVTVKDDVEDSRVDVEDSGIESFLDFIGDFYEASYRPELWGQVFKRLCDLVGAKSGGIFLWDHVNNVQAIIACHGLSRLAQISYRFGFAKYDYSYKLMVQQDVGKAQDIVRHDQVRESNPLFYRFLLKPNDVGFIAGINLHKDQELYIGMAVHRGFAAEPFGERELQILQRVYPHFQRAIRIQSEIQRLKQKQQSLSGALSQISLGLIFIDAQGQVSYCNQLAQQLLEKNQALSLIGGGLRAHYPQEQQRLTQLLQQLAASEIEINSEQAQAMTLHHPQRQLPLTLMISRLPVNDEVLEMFAERGSLAIYISDPEQGAQLTPEQLKSLYQLTPSEARVAIALVNGLELAQIASLHGTSVGTVRSQLGQVFTKMGVSRQLDVVRLLTQGLASLQLIPGLLELSAQVII